MCEIVNTSRTNVTCAATLEAIEHHTTAPDRIQALVHAITPAIEQSKGQPGDALDNAVLANTALTVGRLEATPLLAEALGKGGLKIIGGRYDLDSGTVVIA